MEFAPCACCVLATAHAVPPSASTPDTPALVGLGRTPMWSGGAVPA